MTKTNNSGTSVKNNRQSLEFMTKMMLMKNSRTTGYSDSLHYYRKNVPNTGR